VIVDRVDRQVLMVAANLVRLATFAVIAFAASTNHISIWPLIGLLVIVGSCEVVFDSTAQAFLPILVEPSQLARANGLLLAAEIVAGGLAGLAIGALLFDLSVGLPFTVNAITFGIGAILISSIRVTRPQQSETSSPLDGRLSVGLRWLNEHSLLRTLAAMFAMTNFGLMLGQGIFVKYAIDELGLSNAEFGLLLAITAMGAATGGLIGPRVIRSIGLRTSVVVPYLIFGSSQLVIGLASAAWMVASAGFLLGAAITVWNIVTVTIRQRVIPSDRFGRVNSVYRWIGAAASAAGVAIGGFIAFWINIRAPFLIGGAVTLVAAAMFAKPILAGLTDED
jgi:MFS family permease